MANFWKFWICIHCPRQIILKSCRSFQFANLDQKIWPEKGPLIHSIAYWRYPKGNMEFLHYTNPSKSLFVKVTPSKAFQSWENTLNTPNYLKVIHEGWSSVRRPVLCESWRETHFRFIHRAIYGFSIPRSGDDLTRLVVRSARPRWLTSGMGFVNAQPPNFIGIKLSPMSISTGVSLSPVLQRY